MNFKRKILSQNFLINDKLIDLLVRRARFSVDDTVLDIGSGKGIIAEKLSCYCKKVLAIEVDSQLHQKLVARFQGNSKVEVYHADIRQFQLPTTPYAVFSNIPFHITADVIYKLLYYSNPPERAYLVMQREAAEKFSGEAGSTQFSILAGPWFEMRILYRFKHADFYPPPKVDVVLLEILKRKEPLIPQEYELVYKNFVKHAFGQWKRNLKIGLKNIFTYTQWKRLARTHGFSIKAKPSDLTLEQWVGIFSFFRTLNEKNF